MNPLGDRRDEWSGHVIMTSVRSEVRSRELASRRVRLVLRAAHYVWSWCNDGLGQLSWAITHRPLSDEVKETATVLREALVAFMNEAERPTLQYLATFLLVAMKLGLSVNEYAQFAQVSNSVDPPPLKWSDLRYVFGIKEDCNGKEAIQA
jgi:hypothetical protein